MQWGERSVEGYANKEKEASRPYARPGIDKDVRLQAMSRIGECAVCIYLNHNPEDLDWGPKLDRGWDIVDLGKKLDVKTSAKRLLIWPVTKNNFLDPPKADIFVSVNGRDWLFENRSFVLLLGWVTTQRFIREHKVAPPPADLDKGTKYMEPAQLDQLDINPKANW